VTEISADVTEIITERRKFGSECNFECSPQYSWLWQCQLWIVFYAMWIVL